MSETTPETPVVETKPVFGFRTSAEIGEIAAALVTAQGEFGAAIKDSQNPAYRSKYADLSSVIEATQEALNKHGIAIMQAPQLDGQMVTVTTRLQHKSGQWYESDLSLPAVQRDRFDAQSVGSAITYGCRYSMQSILCVPRADDDGNAASGIGSKEAAQEVARKQLEEKTKSDNPKIRKIAEEGLAKLDAKAPEIASNGQQCLFYIWFDESQTAEITGAESLKTANKDLLKPLWSNVARALIANAQQLEDLKYQLEQRKVQFRPLQAAKA